MHKEEVARDPIHEGLAYASYFSLSGVFPFLPSFFQLVYSTYLIIINLTFPIIEYNSY